MKTRIVYNWATKKGEYVGYKAWRGLQHMFYYPSLPLGIKSNLLHLAAKDVAGPSEENGVPPIDFKGTINV